MSIYWVIKLLGKRHLDRTIGWLFPVVDKRVICRSPNGHIRLQVLICGHKQYRYHPDWHDVRNETKFHHLYEFENCCRRCAGKQKRYPVNRVDAAKVLATAIDLMEKTYIRVGNESYEKANGSYGLTTLRISMCRFNQTS